MCSGATAVQSVPFVMVVAVGQGAFRGLDHLRTTVVVAMAVAACNIVLDPILIFNCGWGVTGAGIATTVSQVNDRLPTEGAYRAGGGAHTRFALLSDRPQVRGDEL